MVIYGARMKVTLHVASTRYFSVLLLCGIVWIVLITTPLFIWSIGEDEPAVSRHVEIMERIRELDRIKLATAEVPFVDRHNQANGRDGEINGSRDGKYQGGDDISEHPDMWVRGKWQEAQIDRFCSKHNLSLIKHSFPSHPTTKEEFLRHVYFDDHHKALFCFMSKVGCTNIRQTLLITTQRLNKVVLAFRKYHFHLDTAERKLESAWKPVSFSNRSLSDELKLERVKAYTKFTIVRHPLERLLSAYLDKLGSPLEVINENTNYFDQLKHDITSRYQAEDYQTWTRTKGDKLSLSFSAYIQWIIDHDEVELNEHFTTQYYNSQPCRMRYNFYGNFRNFKSDALKILRQFLSDTSIFSEEESGRNTRTTMIHYYHKLPYSQKKALKEKYSLELDYYHYLYPLELPVTQELLTYNH